MKQREARHPVAVPARLRLASGWTDATILNLSNRGLMFRSRERLERGHFLELRRGGHVIVAQVVWSEDGCHGARAQGVLPVADIVLDKAPPRGLLGLGDRRAERRVPREAADTNRQRGRATQFFLAGIGVTCAAFLLADTAFGVLAKPLDRVEMALAGPSR